PRFAHRARALPGLPSLPTRRSSDLQRAGHLCPQVEADQHEAGLRVLPANAAQLGAEPGCVERLAVVGLLEAQRLDVVPQSRQVRSEEHTSELQSPDHLVWRLLLEKK